MATVDGHTEPPSNALAPAPSGTGEISELLASRIGALIAASEDAAKTIREDARVEAETLRQTVAHEAQQAVARISDGSELEAEVDRLRVLVTDLQGQVERLSTELQLLGGGSQPSLPRGGGANEPVDHDRRAMLIALNMATNGATRDETARYLAENLEIRDCDDLLDTVFRYVGPPH